MYERQGEEYKSTGRNRFRQDASIVRIHLRCSASQYSPDRRKTRRKNNIIALRSPEQHSYFFNAAVETRRYCLYLRTALSYFKNTIIVETCNVLGLMSFVIVKQLLHGNSGTRIMLVNTNTVF